MQVPLLEVSLQKSIQNKSPVAKINVFLYWLSRKTCDFLFYSQISSKWSTKFIFLLFLLNYSNSFLMFKKSIVILLLHSLTINTEALFWIKLQLWNLSFVDQCFLTLLIHFVVSKINSFINWWRIQTSEVVVPCDSIKSNRNWSL